MSRRRQRGRAVHGILLFDKPTGCSSNGALQRVKRLYDARKAGHTGSLDPLATGMLPLCFGEATKICGYLLDADKEYVTTARFGVTTDSCDADGEVVTRLPIPTGFDSAMVEQASGRFVGEIDQVPPMYSAIKVDGQRLYKLARQGVEIERAARRVQIFSIATLRVQDDLATLRVRCSKGTYIRTLVADIGDALGCGAHVESLRRLTVSPFAEPAMITEETLSTLSEQGMQALDELLLPVDVALEHLERTDLDTAAASSFRQGQSVSVAPEGRHQEGTGDERLQRVYCADRFLGIGKLVGGGIKPLRVFNL